MYRDTLGVSFPEHLDDIHRAIIVRHALVHRNGKLEEEYVVITKERVRELADKIDEFIRSIADQMKCVQEEDLPF